MRALLLLAALAAPAGAGDLGGHEAPVAAAEGSSPDARKKILEDMWQRRLLPPDQTSWAPADLELLNKIHDVERDALAYFRRRPGGVAPWAVRVRTGFLSSFRLTKEGYQRYLFLLSQDAESFFEDKGADAKDVFKLRDWGGKPLFDGAGRLTDEGRRVYDRARLNLEVYWTGPDGHAYGTRRPPTKTP